MTVTPPAPLVPPVSTAGKIVTEAIAITGAITGVCALLSAAAPSLHLSATDDGIIAAVAAGSVLVGRWLSELISTKVAVNKAAKVSGLR